MINGKLKMELATHRSRMTRDASESLAFNERRPDARISCYPHREARYEVLSFLPVDNTGSDGVI